MSNNAEESRHKKWCTLIKEHEKSGLSQKAFCEQNDIVLSQFVYYRGQIKSSEKIANPSSPLFSPVQLQKNTPTDSREMRIILPNGFQCIFPCAIDAITIKKCLGVLLSC